jgi:hypothetical protein
LNAHHRRIPRQITRSSESRHRRGINQPGDFFNGIGASRTKWIGRACLLCPGSSDVNLFRYGEGIIDLDTEVPDSAFDLGITEQELHGSQITSTPVDQGRLGPS